VGCSIHPDEQAAVIAEYAVRLARAIVAEVERTEPHEDLGGGAR